MPSLEVIGVPIIHSLDGTKHQTGESSAPCTPSKGPVLHLLTNLRMTRRIGIKRFTERSESWVSRIVEPSFC